LPIHPHNVTYLALLVVALNSENKINIGTSKTQGNHRHNLANNTEGEGVEAKSTMGIGSCRR